jgi:hypothetical protein
MYTYYFSGETLHLYIIHIYFKMTMTMNLQMWASKWTIMFGTPLRLRKGLDVVAWNIALWWIIIFVPLWWIIGQIHIRWLTPKPHDASTNYPSAAIALPSCCCRGGHPFPSLTLLWNLGKHRSAHCVWRRFRRQIWQFWLSLMRPR